MECIEIKGMVKGKGNRRKKTERKERWRERRERETEILPWDTPGSQLIV